MCHLVYGSVTSSPQLFAYIVPPWAGDLLHLLSTGGKVGRVAMEEQWVIDLLDYAN